MSIALAYWIVLLLSLILNVLTVWPLSSEKVKAQGPNILLFALLVLVGWKVFGAPVHS